MNRIPVDVSVPTPRPEGEPADFIWPEDGPLNNLSVCCQYDPERGWQLILPRWLTMLTEAEAMAVAEALGQLKRRRAIKKPGPVTAGPGQFCTTT